MSCTQKLEMGEIGDGKGLCGILQPRNIFKFGVTGCKNKVFSDFYHTRLSPSTAFL